MIKNIIFDIGNVLVDYKPVEFLARKGFSEPVIKRILKASVLSPYWEQFERADLTEEEAMSAFVSLDPEIERELYKAYTNIKGMLLLRDFAVDWVRNLKEAGYKVYYLSNYSKKAYNECRESLAFMKDMEGGFLSFQERITKPDPEIYRRFLKRFGLKPEESVFVDDTEQNVSVAKELGFHGIIFTSYESTVEQLAALGVESKRRMAEDETGR